jgi:hypothetical protein
LLRWYDEEDLSVLDMIDTYPNQVNFWNKWLVKRTWGKEVLADYEPILPCNLEKNIAYDSCLSHLGWLQGYRPGNMEVVKQGGLLPDKMLRYMKEKGTGLIFV